MLAYKIDAGIHNLKVLAGISDGEWHYYTSINFYLVLLFGFAAYLVWGYMFEMMLKEKTKKSVDIKAAIIIKGLKEEISLLRIELNNLETRIIELETQLKAVTSQIEQLKKELEKSMQNQDALSQNLTSFYMGWQQYLNNTTEFVIEKEQCEQIFNEFIQLQFHQVNSAN
jgi:prefoldin subunit 5